MVVLTEWQHLRTGDEVYRTLAKRWSKVMIALFAVGVVTGTILSFELYGWDRMSPRRHLLCGLPVIVAGFTGSLFVLSVNAWMNNPSGFRIEDGRAVDVRPWGALFGLSLIHI